MSPIDRRTILVGTAALALTGAAPPTAPPAPGPAWRGWTRTRGGGGGRTLKVTNLAPSGPGSLRAALDAEGPRTIVFAVGGVIDLARRSLSIRQPFITIAGETAPAPGITIIRGGIGISTHDVIVRHIRVRAGADGAPPRSGWEVDGLATTAAHDVIVDQCSFAWATDENLSASGPRFAGGDDVGKWRLNTSRRIDFTRNIVAEGLSRSSHAKGEHSKGSLVHDNATEVLIAGNLYAHNYERNPLFKGGVQAACVNNVVYDPGNRCLHYALNMEEWVGRRWVRGELSLVGNHVKGGRSTRADLPFLIVEGQGDLGLHMIDNLATHRDGRAMQAIGIISTGDPHIVRHARPRIWPAGLVPLPVARVEAAVLAQAGARPWNRDALDRRIIAQVRDGTGRVIDNEREVGGYAGLTG